MTGIDSASNNLPAANTVTGKYVAQVAVDEGVITATMQAAGTNGTSSLIGGQTLTLTPTMNAGSISWACGGTLDAKYRPKNC